MNASAGLISQLAPMDNGSDSGLPGIFGAFFAIFILMFIGGIVLSVVKFSRTRQMAMDKGATDAEATAIALSGDVGTAAAFIKPGAQTPPKSSAERITEIRSLQTQGLISPEQAQTRIDEILRGI